MSKAARAKKNQKRRGKETDDNEDMITIEELNKVLKQEKGQTTTKT